MKGISINETVEDEYALADLLREIARQIEAGFTSGYHPGWEILDEEVEEDD